MNLLILATRADAHADAIVDAASARDLTVLRLHPAELLRGHTLSIENDGPRIRVHACGGASHRIETSLPFSIYNREWTRVVPPSLDGPTEVLDWACEESATNLDFALGALDDCRWITHPDDLRRARVRATQLRSAHAVGLRTPATLWSNQPEAVLDFVERNGGTVLLKPQSQVHFRLSGRPHTSWVSRASATELRAAGDSLLLGPMCYQAEVLKRADYRAIVVGERVFAARVRGSEDQVDVRDGDGPITMEPTVLDASTCRALVALNERLGVRFGAMDLVEDDEGLVFLESNVNGNWLGVELDCGHAIAEALVDELMA